MEPARTPSCNGSSGIHWVASYGYMCRHVRALACVLTCVVTCVVTSALPCVLTWVWKCVSTYMLTCLSTCVQTCVLIHVSAHMSMQIVYEYVHAHVYKCVSDMFTRTSTHRAASCNRHRQPYIQHTRSHIHCTGGNISNVHASDPPYMHHMCIMRAPYTAYAQHACNIGTSYIVQQRLWGSTD